MERDAGDGTGCGRWTGNRKFIWSGLIAGNRPISNPILCHMSTIALNKLLTVLLNFTAH